MHIGIGVRVWGRTWERRSSGSMSMSSGRGGVGEVGEVVEVVDVVEVDEVVVLAP